MNYNSKVIKMEKIDVYGVVEIARAYCTLANAKKMFKEGIPKEGEKLAAELILSEVKNYRSLFNIEGGKFIQSKLITEKEADNLEKKCNEILSNKINNP